MTFDTILTFRELLRIFQILFGVVILISFAEIVRRRYVWTHEFNRKFIHVGVGAFIFFAPLLFTRAQPVLLISALFACADFIAYRRGWIRSMHASARRSYGTVYYPLSLFVLTLFLWNTSPIIVVAAMMLMVAGDAAAGIVGELIRRPHEFRLTSDKKSIEGSAAMFAVSALALVGTWLMYRDAFPDIIFAAQHSAVTLGLLAVALALFATAWEAISSRGLDNLTVPIASAWALGFALLPAFHGDPHRFIVAAALGASIAAISIRFRFLQWSGSVATFLLATIVFSIGGWMWTVPILAFFILSSVLSKIGRARKTATAQSHAKGDVRDYVQVLANGGIPGILALCFFFDPRIEWYALFLAAIAAVTADTWASEIGMLNDRPPKNILTMKPDTPGASGAVSFGGTIGGFVGAIVIAASGLPFMLQIDGEFTRWSWMVIAIIIAGNVGNVIDSLLGATLQAQYRCNVCGASTEKRVHCADATILVRGMRWMDNDAVNLLCGASGATIAWLLLQII